LKTLAHMYGCQDEAIYRPAERRGFKEETAQWVEILVSITQMTEDTVNR